MEISEHLNEAYRHLQAAMKVSVKHALENPASQKEIGKQWENFISQFFHLIKQESKASKINILSWISFNKIWKD